MIWALPDTDATTGPFFAKLADAIGAPTVCSTEDTGELELSEHPTSTNATLAISRRRKDKVLMGISFLNGLRRGSRW